MPTIYIDNKPYEVKKGQNLLQACLSLGFDIPYFCWHPILGSVGSCRQCAVKLFKNEDDTRGQIVMSCMTEVENGTRISIDDPDVKKFRASIIQWLMLNHPHDCPVCDEGGECHLQDMTVMTGHVYRKTRFKKRTYRNQDLGPFIHHEMNRCIQCYRCVRFYRDFAGGKDLDVFGIHDRIYFGKFQEGPLESEFSGNLVEVCPTGVFTDGTLRRHFSRKWDLQTAPSICVHCGLGCNTIPGERYGSIRRIRNRYNNEVNGYFLCDRGRFGYEFVNSEYRIRHPLHKSGPETVHTEITGEMALDSAASILESASGIIGIGSPRASLEANYALMRLVGSENFSIGLSAKEQDILDTASDILTSGPAQFASLQQIAQADAVLVLGEDVTNTAPMMALQLRQTSRNRFMDEVDNLGIPRWNAQNVKHVIAGRKGPFFVATPYETKLDDLATDVFRGAPQDIARLGFAIAHTIDEHAPVPEDLDQAVNGLAESITSALNKAQRPLIVSGVTSGNRYIIQAAANIAWALNRQGSSSQLSLVVPECNSLGVSLIGGIALEEAFSAIQNGKADTLIVLENDFYRRLNSEKVDQGLAAVKNLVVLDHVMNRTASKADLIFPSGTFAESCGTLVNNEGRAQRFFQVFQGEGEILASWHWIRDLMLRLRRPEATQWKHWDDILNAMVNDLEPFSELGHLLSQHHYWVHDQKIPRQPQRYSGRTAMHANLSVHEEPPPQDVDSALSFSMEGLLRIENSSLIPRYWAPGWNSVQALNKFQDEIAGGIKGNEVGQRLFEPKGNVPRAYFAEYPKPYQPDGDEWLMVPMCHIFGSEELSALSGAVAQKVPALTLGLNPATAEKRGLKEGARVVLEVDDSELSITIRLMPDLAPDVAALPTYRKDTGFIQPESLVLVRDHDDGQ